MNWADSPLAAIVRHYLARYPEDPLAEEARWALHWAANEDLEVDRIAREALAEARAEITKEKG